MWSSSMHLFFSHRFSTAVTVQPRRAAFPSSLGPSAQAQHMCEKCSTLLKLHMCLLQQVPGAAVGCEKVSVTPKAHLGIVMSL